MLRKIVLFTMMIIKSVQARCYKVRPRKELAEAMRAARRQERDLALLRYRVAIGRCVSVRHRDGREWQCLITDVAPRGGGDVRLIVEAPKDTFHAMPVLLFDAFMPWWEVWLKGDEEPTTVEVRFDWEDEWRADCMPTLPSAGYSVVGYA